MGLTIHYTLQSAAGNAEQARQLVERLRKHALDLPFAQVDEVVEATGDACDFNGRDRDDPVRWLLVKAGQYVERDGTYYPVKPKHFIAFGTFPGEGCEAAVFGLAAYPATIEVQNPRTRRSRQLRTGLTGWCWSSFCKTEYASGHGIDHFLRCHLCVIRMLDHAKELGILGGVKDEGGFWEKRDVKALAQKVGEWNEGMAGLVGQLKDMFGGNLVAPIMKYPAFEHLEAKGRGKKPRSSSGSEDLQ
jgi:hypothetical protein